MKYLECILLNPNKDLLNARIEEIGDLMQKEADATNQLVN